jgi:uncharacterized membrane protein
MTIRWLLAAFHLLALGVGLGAVWARGHALQAQLDVPGLRRVFYTDTWWGVAALARISFVQGILVVLMVLAATAMARGYGVPHRG